MRPERFPTVCTLDPALDTDRMPWDVMAEFIRTRDLSKVEPFYKPGVDPTIYYVREVPHALWDTYVMAGTEAQQARRAFACGVERAKNVYQRDGVKLPDMKPTYKHGSGQAIMDDAEMAQFSHAEIKEIGEVVLAHSFLPLRIEGCFRLPDLLATLLVSRRAFLPADASPDSAAPSNGKPSGTEGPAIQSPAETGSDSATREGDGGAATDAPAEATT